MSAKDVEYDPAEESTYECYECGTVVVKAHGGRCPDCGGEMRNRRTPLL